MFLRHFCTPRQKLHFESLFQDTGETCDNIPDIPTDGIS